MKLAESIYGVKQIQAVAEASGLPAAEYISRLISSANPDAVNPDDGASLAAFIAEKKYGETPVIGEKRGIAELLEQALDCKLREATEQLRQQALENERQLAERNAHLAATESEIEHLLSTVSELKTAEAAEQHHLLQTIADLKDAQVAEVDHLKQTIEALQRAHRESEDAIKVRLAEAMAGLQEREATLAKSQEELFSLRQFKSQHAPHLAERGGAYRSTRRPHCRVGGQYNLANGNADEARSPSFQVALPTSPQNGKALQAGRRICPISLCSRWHVCSF